MRAVSLEEAEDRLDELVTETVAGEEVVIAVDEKYAVRLERLRRWEELSAEEKKASVESILALLKKIHTLPAPEPRGPEEILEDEYGEDGVFGLTLEVKDPMDEKSGVRQEPVVEKARIFGLDQGKLVIPDDFDAPMPEIERLFYGSDR